MLTGNMSLGCERVATAGAQPATSFTQETYSRFIKCQVLDVLRTYHFPSVYEHQGVIPIAQEPDLDRDVCSTCRQMTWSTFEHAAAATARLAAAPETIQTAPGPALATTICTALSYCDALLVSDSIQCL